MSNDNISTDAMTVRQVTEEEMIDDSPFMSEPTFTSLSVGLFSSGFVDGTTCFLSSVLVKGSVDVAVTTVVAV